MEVPPLRSRRHVPAAFMAGDDEVWAVEAGVETTEPIPPEGLGIFMDDAIWAMAGSDEVDTAEGDGRGLGRFIEISISAMAGSVVTILSPWDCAIMAMEKSTAIEKIHRTYFTGFIQ